MPIARLTSRSRSAQSRPDIRASCRSSRQAPYVLSIRAAAAFVDYRLQVGFLIPPPRRLCKDATMTPTRPRYAVADMFCGCGGLSLGLELTGRMETGLGLDVLPEAVDTFAHNHQARERPPIAMCEDIRTVPAESLADSLTSQGITSPGDLACLVGGPPCEGFSQNRSVNAGGQRQTD